VKSVVNASKVQTPNPIKTAASFFFLTLVIGWIPFDL
jgi:hypothetical protein